MDLERRKKRRKMKMRKGVSTLQVSALFLQGMHKMCWKEDGKEEAALHFHFPSGNEFISDKLSRERHEERKTTQFQDFSVGERGRDRVRKGSTEQRREVNRKRNHHHSISTTTSFILRNLTENEVNVYDNFPDGVVHFVLVWREEEGQEFTLESLLLWKQMQRITYTFCETERVRERESGTSTFPRETKT